MAYVHVKRSSAGNYIANELSPDNKGTRLMIRAPDFPTLVSRLTKTMLDEVNDSTPTLFIGGISYDRGKSGTLSRQEKIALSRLGRLFDDYSRANQGELIGP